MTWQHYFAYAAFWIVGLVYFSFVAAFAWFNLKHNQRNRGAK